MPDGKRGNQDKHPLYIPAGVYACQRQNKQLVVQGIGADDMLPPHLKIKTKVGHCETIG